MKMYDYLVAYHFSRDGQIGASYGATQISRKHKIKTFKDLEELRDFIASQIEGAYNVGIYNFILLGRNKH